MAQILQYPHYKARVFSLALQQVMGLVDKIWDDPSAGTRAETGIGRVRKLVAAAAGFRFSGVTLSKRVSGGNEEGSGCLGGRSRVNLMCRKGCEEREAEEDRLSSCPGIFLLVTTFEL